ncbi:MAG TPA: DEAD/DEAH box helicase, partial [Gaiellaceae bacterium]
MRDALRLDSNPDGEERYRNVLLPVIAAVVDTEPSRGVDELTDATVDAAVSTCLAQVDEDPITSFSAFAPACQILARDGQFARLSALGSRIESLDVRLRAERPFLAVSLRALGACMRSEYPRAKIDLEASLGIATDSSPVARVARTPVQVADVFLANALRNWLEDRELSTSSLEKARQVALDLADPALHEASELALAFCRASSAMRTDRLVPAAAPEFEEPRLAHYLARRGVRVLFPGQLRAIQGGALRNGSRVIAMPTSSGKTLLAELRLASRLGDPDARAIYLAPYRLLARQVERSLRTGLRAANLSVKDLGGGYDLAVEDDLAPGELPRVAVMTPERMDALLRLSTTQSKGSEEARELLASVRLVIFDEMHLLGRSGRGARLELFTARIRDSLPNCDILGLSAAAEGVQALSGWLGGEDAVSGGRRPTGVIELLWRTDGSIVQRFENSVATVHSIPRAQ